MRTRQIKPGYKLQLEEALIFFKSKDLGTRGGAALVNNMNKAAKQ